MSEADRVKRVLLGMADLNLRVTWLRDFLGRNPGYEAAVCLNELCEQSESLQPEAREAVLTLAMLFVRLGNAPLVGELGRQAVAGGMLSLDRLLRRGADDCLPYEPAQPPVPDYGTGRELTVGERRSLARRPDRRAFERLLKDPHVLVIRQLLGNPKLTEDDVIQLATRRPARALVLAELAQTDWLARSRVRMALIQNPGSPTWLSVPLVSTCNRNELSEVLRSTDIPAVVRGVARELLARRPPLPPPHPSALQ